MLLVWSHFALLLKSDLYVQQTQLSLLTVMLNVVMLSITMLNIVLLRFISLNVIILNVVAPTNPHWGIGFLTVAGLNKMNKTV
jgi:hypothetical protein